MTLLIHLCVAIHFCILCKSTHNIHLLYVRFVLINISTHYIHLLYVRFVHVVWI